MSVGVFLLQLFQLAISGCSVIVFASGPVVFILIESIGNRTGDLVELAGRWITVDLSGFPGLGIGIPVFAIIIPACTGVLVVAIAAALFVVEGDAVDQADLVVVFALANKIFGTFIPVKILFDQNAVHFLTVDGGQFGTGAKVKVADGVLVGQVVFVAPAVLILIASIGVFLLFGGTCVGILLCLVQVVDQVLTGERAVVDGFQHMFDLFKRGARFDDRIADHQIVAFFVSLFPSGPNGFHQLFLGFRFRGSAARNRAVLGFFADGNRDRGGFRIGILDSMFMPIRIPIGGSTFAEINIIGEVFTILGFEQSFNDRSILDGFRFADGDGVILIAFFAGIGLAVLGAQVIIGDIIDLDGNTAGCFLIGNAPIRLRQINLSCVGFSFGFRFRMGNRPADPLELLVGDNSADLVAGLAFVPQLLFQIGLDLCQLVYIGGGIGERVSLAVVLINNGSDTVNGFILFLGGTFRNGKVRRNAISQFAINGVRVGITVSPALGTARYISGAGHGVVKYILGILAVNLGVAGRGVNGVNSSAIIIEGVTLVVGVRIGELALVGGSDRCQLCIKICFVGVKTGFLGGFDQSSPDGFQLSVLFNLADILVFLDLAGVLCLFGDLNGIAQGLADGVDLHIVQLNAVVVELAVLVLVTFVLQTVIKLLRSKGIRRFSFGDFIDIRLAIFLALDSINAINSGLIFQQVAKFFSGEDLFVVAVLDGRQLDLSG